MAMLAVAAAGAAVGSAALGTGVVAFGMTGAQIGWMVGSMIGSALFAEKAQGPRIADGKFTSTIYGQAIPISYGTIDHGAHIAWWSGLNTRTEEIGGKGGGGAEVEKASMNLLLAVCEGPQEAVLRIWANGRLIAQFNGTGFDLDEEVLPGGEVRVYLGTEDQTADPTYEAAVGAENAVPYRGMVMVAIDGLEGEQFANRPPSFKVEVTSNLASTTCPTQPFTITPVEHGGLFLGNSGLWSQDNNAAVYDPVEKRYYVVTDGPPGGESRRLEGYSVTGEAASLDFYAELWAWNRTGVTIGGLGFDPENGLIRIAGGLNTPLGYYGGTIEHVFDGATMQTAQAKFANGWLGSWVFTWGNYPVDGDEGGTGALYGAMYSIYPDNTESSIGANLGEAGWWIHGTAFINYRLAHLISDDAGRGWHHSSNDGRRNETAQVVYVPKGEGIYSGNYAWQWSGFRGYYDANANATPIVGADVDDGSDRWTVVVHAKRRQKVYVLADKSIAAVDISTATGDPLALSSPLTEIDGLTSIPVRPTFAVWNERHNGLVIGRVWNGGTVIYMIDPDTRAVMFGPCFYDNTERIRAPADIEDGRFVCILGSDQIAIVAGIGGTATGGPITLREIVEDVCTRAGLPAVNLDASAGTDLVGGYRLSQQSTARQAIESLRPGYFFDMPESGTRLVLRKRGAAPVATLDEGEMGARLWSSGGEPSPAYELEHVEEIEAPQRLELTYIDAGANYDPGLQRAQRQVGQSTAPAQLEVPVVFYEGHQEAARAAWVNLLHAHASKNPIRFNLSHEYEHIEAADAVLVPLAAGVLQRVRVEKITRGRPLVEIEGVLEDASIYTQDMGGAPRYQGPKQVGIAPLSDTVLELLDVPPLRASDDRPVLYSALARSRSADAWPGASVYKSIDGGSSYSSVYSTAYEATMGRLVTPLPAWAGGNVFDRVNTVDVRLSHGTLSSVTQRGLLNGANAAVIGDEVVQFQNATLIGDRTWRLDTLLRHRIGTEWAAAAGHGSGARFVLLSEAMLRVIEYPSAEIGLERHWKGVTGGKTLADAAAHPLAAAGNSVRPLAPSHVAGVRAPGGDLSVTWIRRARINADWRDSFDVPLDEPSERYRVEVYSDATRTTLVRAEDVTSAAWVYSAADQSTDFGSAQAVVHLNIYQITPTYNLLGHATEATV